MVITKNPFLYISLIIIIFIAIGIGYIICNLPVSNNDYQKIIYKLDSIENTQIRLRDSLNIVNDTITNKIEKVHTIYEKNVENVLNQSHDSDWLFLKNYLSRYNLNESGLEKIESDSITAQ